MECLGTGEDSTRLARRKLIDWLVDKNRVVTRNAGGFYKDLEVVITTAVLFLSAGC